jgi:hypothetical protein
MVQKMNDPDRDPDHDHDPDHDLLLKGPLW